MHTLSLYDSMQDALLHLQCTVPPERVDTFTVNGILIAATQSKQLQLLVLHQCLDILQERSLAWNATTWRQVFRLQAGFHHTSTRHMSPSLIPSRNAFYGPKQRCCDSCID